MIGVLKEDQVVLNLWLSGYERETTTIQTFVSSITMNYQLRTGADKGNPTV